MLESEQLTQQIIGAAMEVHKALGPGLLESSYKACLCRELAIRGLSFQSEVPLPITYKGVSLDCGYRIDLMVANTVVPELKSLEAILPRHEAQLLTYLKLSGKRVGLLINFNVDVLKDGIKRRIL